MNVLTPVAVRIGAIPWLPRFLRQITAFDMFLQRLTRGRWSLLRLAGLPSLLLTVVGRKSGLPRATPLLCVPWRTGVLVAGSNFGGATTPAWVGNVRAAGRVTMRFGGRTGDAVPHELRGDDRAAAWAHMLRTWPNYQRYADRTGREIPVFYLEPVT
jgi:deazaflavin-dependent oxidoreductase (nitroreductase family)